MDCRRCIASIARPAWTLLACLATGLVLVAPAAPARAELVLSDPGSPVYYRHALAAEADVHVDKDTTVEGDVRGNSRVLLDRGSRVEGDVTAVRDVLDKGTVTGAVQEGAQALLLPRLAGAAELRALADRVIDGNHTFTDAVIDDVVYVAGRVWIEGRIAGRGTVIAERDIVVSAVDEGSGPGLLATGARLSLITPAGIRLGQYRAFRGAAYSGADLWVEKGGTVEGVLISGKKIHVQKDSVVRFLDLDQTPPVIGDLAPPPDAWVNTRRPQVAASFADDLSLVDPATVEVLLDGEPVTPAELSSAGFAYLPAQDLRPGEHAVAVSLADHSDNPASTAWTFRIDTTQPRVRFAAPGPNSVLTRVVAAEPVLDLFLDLYDSGSGIDLSTLEVAVDGQPLACDGDEARVVCPTPALATGSYRATASVADLAGNVDTAALDFAFALDLEPPSVTVVAPADGSFFAASPVTVEVSAADDVGLAELAVNGTALPPQLGAQTVQLELLEGPNPVTVVARDEIGREAVAQVDVVLDTVAPEISVLSPRSGSTVNAASAPVRVRVDDFGGVAGVEIGGSPAVRDGLDWVGTAPLAAGTNRVPVRAVDRAGNTAETAVDIELFTLPEVEIDSPEDLAYLASTTATVSGTVSDPAAAVSVNGVAATVEGGRFTAVGVPLIEGGNLITASASDSVGHVGTDTINVVRDLSAPRLQVRTPRPGAVLVQPSVTVGGLVNDIVAGTVNPAQAAVTVNGVAAEVANRSFVAPGVPLQPGLNELVVRAVDASGNEARTTVRVTLDPARRAVEKVSGDRQSAPIDTPLAEPLVVAVRDAAGEPMEGVSVLFKVVEGDGSFPDGSRRLAVITGPQGRAGTRFTLGGRSGRGAQSVEALIVGFAGEAVFTFDALPGAPAEIVVDAGNEQVGIAGQSLPRPLVATVIDAGANRLPGVPVVLQVLQGGGRFADGEAELRVSTDSDGRVVVPFTLGPDEGVSSNTVAAVVEGAPEAGQATFVATGWVAGDPADTAIRGVVLDNTNRPIPGVTMRILGSDLTAVTNAEGRFRMAPAPVGTVKLIADGSTADRPGAWPDLEFVLTTVSGRDNDVGRPIFLLPLDLDNGIYVDETTGGTITLPEIPGFALEVEPGSVTFPGGSKSGLLSVTAVHADKVPMAPNFGQQPQLIVTIQPAGARFEPPARLTLPNVETLAPGQVTDMYSFDHDLGHFVSIGPGVVSDDGTVIRSAPGVGVIKAGWHCGGDPSGSGTTHDCPECETCENDVCVPDDDASPGGPCVSVSLSSEFETATSLAEQALEKVPFVDEVSVGGSLNGEACPTCCNGSKLMPGEISGGGSITAEATIEKTLSPIDIRDREFERTFFGIEVEFEVDIAVGPFIRGTPVVSFDTEASRDLCKGENCLSVQGCGGFTLTVGGQARSVLEFEVEAGDEELFEIEVEVVIEASASAPGVAFVEYASGAACDGTGWEVDGCLADVTGDIIVIIDDFFETSLTWTFFEGTDGCGCG